MAEPVLCPVMPELVEVLRQPGGWVTSKPVRIWLASDNVLWVEEKRTTRRSKIVRMESLSDEVRRVLAYLFDETNWECPACHYRNIYRNRDGSLRLECKYCNDGEHPLKDVLDECDITPPESGSDVQRYDGSRRDDG